MKYLGKYLGKYSRYSFFTLIFLFSLSSPAISSILEDIKIDYLDNGLKVVTIEDHKDPVITFQVWYRVGGMNEITGKTGLAHLTEHMMFKGTKKYEKGEVSRTVARHGGNENAFTSQEYTAYFQNFAKEKLHISLELESDRMVNLVVDPREFLLERDVVMEERRQRTDDDPTSSVVEEMYASAFKVHPYRNPVIGWMNDLENLQLEDLLDWYRTYYVPNNATVIVAGDITRAEVLPEIKKYFGSIPKGDEPPPVTIVEPEQRGERRVWVKKEAQLPFIFAGYKTPNIGHPDEFALEVIANILSSGKSSRLYKSLVYDKQTALYAGGSYDGLSKAPGLFYFYAAAKPGVKTDDVENGIYDVLEKLKKEGVTDLEIEKAKNQIEAHFVMSQDSIFYQAMTIGRIESAGIDYSYLDAYLDNVRKVTKEDVMRVANQYFIQGKRTVGILIPLKKGEHNEKH
ncbi:MAG: insulinase family protein [Deltaproteobacteria bacterium]|nr:insulinase family protein [Deltaproteobacteria bacterium]